MNEFITGISSNLYVWISGVALGGFIGAIITFLIAEGRGFREGTIRMQLHHEKLSTMPKEAAPETHKDLMESEIDAPALDEDAAPEKELVSA